MITSTLYDKTSNFIFWPPNYSHVGKVWVLKLRGDRSKCRVKTMNLWHWNPYVCIHYFCWNPNRKRALVLWCSLTPLTVLLLSDLLVPQTRPIFSSSSNTFGLLHVSPSSPRYTTQGTKDVCFLGSVETRDSRTCLWYQLFIVHSGRHQGRYSDSSRATPETRDPLSWFRISPCPRTETDNSVMSLLVPTVIRNTLTLIGESRIKIL